MPNIRPKVSLQSVVFGVMANLLLLLELQASLVQQFELETVPFMQRGAVLVGLGRDYKPLNVSKEICIGAWSCLLKSCEMFTQNPDSLSYVATNPLVKVSTCQLGFDLDRLIGDEDAMLYRNSQALITTSGVLIGVQVVFGIIECIVIRRRSDPEEAPLVTNNEPRKSSRRCTCLPWFYIAFNLLAKVFLVVATVIIIHITKHFSDVPDPAKRWETVAKISFIIGMIAEGTSSVFHSCRRQRHSAEY